MVSRNISLPVTGLVVLMLTACAAVGPNYVRPTPSAPITWYTELKSGEAIADDSGGLASWWSVFNDPELTILITRAIYGNLDLKRAQSRIREARAQRMVAKAGLLPSLDFKGSAARTWTSQNSSQGRNTDDLYSTSFDASWEIDIFGGVRRSLEAGDADIGAAIEDMRDVLVTLLSEVALSYVDTRSYQARLAVAEANLASQTETYQLTSWRAQAGLTDELALQQASYNLENTRSQMPTLKTALEGSINRIAVLLGEQPGKIHDELQRMGSIPTVPVQIAIAVPADALRQRPDVRRAERELAAQTARAGVATAELYPKLTLNGSIGLDATTIRDFFTTPVRTTSFGPGISWPIFSGGQIRANIEVQSAKQEQAILSYEGAVLNALKEVENALTAYAQEQDRLISLDRSVQAARKAKELAEAKYQAGLADFTGVLDAQRSLYSLQDQWTQSRSNLLSDVVRIYKALGGGWQCFMPEEDKQAENR
jgi:outer membrane protein, multidrug efflux system